MKFAPTIFLLVCLFATATATVTVRGEGRFETIVLGEAFHSEGAAVADIDGDGENDIVSGPFWYQGPEFRRRFAYASVKESSIQGYSDHFFTFIEDLNHDSHPDIVSIPIPGSAAVWYENPTLAITPTQPGKTPAQPNGNWKKHLVLGGLGNESPQMSDIDGDGARELVCIHAGQYGYAKPDPSDPTQPWKFVPISDDRGYGRFTHGLGVGDVDSDGRQDLLEKDGWWQQGQRLDQPFAFHRFPFAESGGSQMFAYDFDGDGDNDVVSVQNAHAYGLCWFERRGDSQDDIVFIKHDILGKQPTENPFGLAISQMHALALADIDGDGIKDIVTGKRFWAHGGRDPGAQELPVLYWFRTTRGRNGVEFIPHLIDARVGVGTQLTTSDIDNDGDVDLVIGNKLGTFLLRNRGSGDSEPKPSTRNRHLVGTDEFKGGVRSTDPLTPEQEQRSFILPTGFRVELFSAEPEIAKPMNMAFDSRGRLWVSSSVEYPYPAPDDREARDTIKILEDTDGDGRADKVTTFADKLNIPMGLYPYRDGVICFSIPNIYYLRDTDGDDVADERAVLYGPFDTTRDTHGMCNAFTRGNDGWLYACHGFNNQSSVAGQDGNVVTMHSGNTFRMRLDGSRIEHFTHGQVNPFGMALDPWGDSFTADCHTKPVTMLLRGGFFESFGKPHDGLGFVPNVMKHLHGSTAIGGIALYHGEQFPDAYRGNSFGGNVMTSRINRNSLYRIGSSVQVREEPDFLISEDPWFRPVDIHVGPDGSMYVADFYNRIIGHYEVPLDHPGRDRQRGRIWKISYHATDNRRDPVTSSSEKSSSPEYASTVNSESGDPTRLRSLIEDLASPNLTKRALATDQLVDEFSGEAERMLRENLLDAPNSDSKIHTLWALHRLEDIRHTDLADAMRDSDARVRSHVMQIAGEQKATNDETQRLILAGLRDVHPHVRRSSALASSVHRSEQFLRPLLDTFHATPEHDAHLRHALRMALRDHLLNPEWFAGVAKSADSKTTATILDLCLAIKTEPSAEYVSANIAKLDEMNPARLSEYLTFAARYASAHRLGALIDVAETRFAGDLDFQERLIRSIQSGLRQRGGDKGGDLSAWATRLAKKRFHMSEDFGLPEIPKVVGWQFVPDANSRQNPNVWVPSSNRNSSDGQQASLLHSSFPLGESRTGIYRSDAFVLPPRFEFFMAGHDGYPQKPKQGKNVVRVCDASSRAVLQSWSPPRNDTAQRFQWDTGDDAGRRVYVELIDGDTATAYAWLAVGRFSVTGLNPNSVTADFRRAANLIEDFSLTGFREPLEFILRERYLGRQDEARMAKAYASLKSSASASATARAISEALNVMGLSAELRLKLMDALLADSNESVMETLGAASSIATAAQQKEIAAALLGDRKALQSLISLVEFGKLSAHLLVEPTHASTIERVASADQKQRIRELTRDLPDNDQQMTTVISNRKEAYLRHSGSVTSGTEIFRKQCGLCHQVAGKGNVVGPNLDGIGNRGLDRILEDVFMPNRNIDAAFRASLVLTEEGKVITGLIKRVEGERMVIVDQKGKEISVAVDEISDQKKIPNSPMSSNFHETLDESKTNDLLAYLLSLTH